jgi:pSer/pThr/pTyr-binding forkhead associated (FHA) protein
MTQEFTDRAALRYTAPVPEIVARLIEPGARGAIERAHDLTLGAHVLGRGAGDDVDVTLDHADVSRRHAELLITHEGASIRDLGSKNGFTVDGRKVSEAILEHGSRVGFGEFVIRLEHPGARVDRLLVRNGELTVRRPRELPRSVSAASLPTPSLIMPLLVTVAFTLLLTALLVLG